MRSYFVIFYLSPKKLGIYWGQNSKRKEVVIMLNQHCKNMFVYGLLIIIVFLQYACVDMRHLCKACGGKITKAEGDLRGNMEYISYKCLVDKKRKQAEVEMWRKAKLEAETSSLPKGGMIVYHYSTPITSYSYEIIVKQGEEVIGRRVDSGTVGYYSGGSVLGGIYAHGSYRGVVICYIDKPVKKPFTVHIINKIAQCRTDISVVPD
jgi:hypothetical protein